MWAYNKNYQRIYSDDHEKGDISEESDDDSTNENGEYVEKDYKGKYETFTYNFLIKRILQHAPETATEKIRIIADKWRLKSNENIIQSMLVNRQDAIVNAYEAFYREDQKHELFIFCIKNQNEIYLKNALQKAIYGASELMR